MKSDGHPPVGSNHTALNPAIIPPTGTAPHNHVGIDALKRFGADSEPKASAAGPMLTNPTPASTRSTMSWVASVAKAVDSENRPKITHDPIMSHLRPIRSAK